MADPRFYINRGPFSLAQICARAGVTLPVGAHGNALIEDLAGLDGANDTHLSFFSGGREMAEAFVGSRAGYCLVPEMGGHGNSPAGMVLLPAASVAHAFAAVASLFYPEASQ